MTVGEPVPQPAGGAAPLLRAVLRSRLYVRWYAVVLVLSMAAPLLATRLVTPIYTSQAVVLYRELVPAQAVLGREVAEETPRQRGTRLRDTVLSRANLEAIIRELDLYADARRGGGIQAAVDELRKVSDCKVTDDTFTVQSAYGDAEHAWRIAQRLAESLVTIAARYRLERALATREFIGVERDEGARELLAREERLAHFLSTHPEFAQDMLAPAGASLAGASVRAQQRKAAAADPAVDALEEQRLRLTRRLQKPTSQEATSTPEASSPGAALVDLREVANTARRDAERMGAELADLRSRYTDAHPDVVAARRRYDLGLRTAADAADRVSVGTPRPRDFPAPAADPQKAKLNVELRALEDSLSRARHRSVARDVNPPGDEVADLETQWVGLNRAVLEARERHEQLEKRLFQASIVANVESSADSSAMTIVDPAYRPELPTARSRVRVAVTAALSMLVLGVCFVWFCASIDDRLVDQASVEALGLSEIAEAEPKRLVRRLARTTSLVKFHVTSPRSDGSLRDVVASLCDAAKTLAPEVATPWTFVAGPSVLEEPSFESALGSCEADTVAAGTILVVRRNATRASDAEAARRELTRKPDAVLLVG